MAAWGLCTVKWKRQIKNIDFLLIQGNWALSRTVGTTLNCPVGYREPGLACTKHKLVLMWMNETECGDCWLPKPIPKSLLHPSNHLPNSTFLRWTDIKCLLLKFLDYNLRSLKKLTFSISPKNSTFINVQLIKESWCNDYIVRTSALWFLHCDGPGFETQRRHIFVTQALCSCFFLISHAWKIQELPFYPLYLSKNNESCSRLKRPWTTL